MSGIGVGAVFALAAAVLAGGAIAVTVGIRRGGAARVPQGSGRPARPRCDAAVVEMEAENPAEPVGIAEVRASKGPRRVGAGPSRVRGQAGRSRSAGPM